MLQAIFKDPFVKRSIVYFLAFILVGIMFAQLFELIPDISTLLSGLANKLP